MDKNVQKVYLFQKSFSPKNLKLFTKAKLSSFTCLFLDNGEMSELFRAIWHDYCQAQFQKASLAEQSLVFILVITNPPPPPGKVVIRLKMNIFLVLFGLVW